MAPPCNIIPFLSSSPVDLDFTIILQAVVFFTVLFALTFLLYRPLINIIEKRSSKTEGVRAEAEKKLKQAKLLEEKYNSKMGEFKRKSEKFIEELRQKARVDERKIIEKSKQEVNQMLEEARAQLQRMEKDIKAKLQPEIEKMAEGLVDKIISKDISR